MAERQRHGLDYENFVFDKDNTLIRTKCYTHRWDGFNRNNTPISIKTKKIGGNKLEMGDFFRQSEVNQDFYIYLGFWQYNKKKQKVLVKEKIYKIPYTYHQLNFREKYVEAQREVFKGVATNEERDPLRDKEWTKRREKFAKRWKESGSKVTPLYKKDHKGQKRIQCSFDLRDIEKYKINEIEHNTILYL